MEAAAPVELSAWPAHPARRHWWLLHAILPVVGLVALAALLHWSGVDRAVAAALYDPLAGRWRLDPSLPLSRLLYHGERTLVIALVVAGLAVLAAGLRYAGARKLRVPVAYLLLSFGATTGLVSLGKHTTNMDCPRALAEYGGSREYVGLFEDRPDDWPRALCFPAGHSSSGFAFVALYFLPGLVRPRWRRLGLAAGVALGLAFAATQWARGMHFPSHDACSAAIAWTVALAMAAVFERRRRRGIQRARDGR